MVHAALRQSVFLVLLVATVAVATPDFRASTSVHAAAAVGKNPAWLDKMEQAGKATKAGRDEEALAIMLSIDERTVTDDFLVLIHGSIVTTAMMLGKYDIAAAANDRTIRGRVGNRGRALKTCALIAMLQNRIARARECAKIFDSE